MLLLHGYFSYIREPLRHRYLGGEKFSQERALRLELLDRHPLRLPVSHCLDTRFFRRRVRVVPLEEVTEGALVSNIIASELRFGLPG